MNLFDSANYPDREPASLIAGDRWMWKRTDLGNDYAPSLYTLKYSLRLQGDGSKEIEITAAASGTDFLIEVDSATTVPYTAGRYTWQSYLIRKADSQRITIGTGTVEVVTNRDATTTDPRGHVRKVLDAIEAVIEGRATKDQQEYKIGDRLLIRTPIPDLILLRRKYRNEYAVELNAERIKNGLGGNQVVKVRI